MIKSLKLFGNVFLLATLLFSCKKENTNAKDELEMVYLNVQIEAGNMYYLHLNTYANSQDIITVAKQATSFDVSEIIKTELKSTYHFKRNKDQKIGTNKETVLLKIYEPRNGIHCEKTEIIINFTII